MTRAEEAQVVREKTNDEHENVIEGYVKLIFWATVILIVVGSVSVIRSFTLQNQVDILDAHTTELQQETDAAKDAAVEARDALQEALDRAPTNDPDAIASALEAVHRIELEICGGPCQSSGG